MAEAVVALLLAAGIGYGAGRAPFQAWESYINRYNERLGHLSYNRVIEPLVFYQNIENARQLYAESVFAYLSGLPNASLPVTFRCLEICLKKYYEKTEKKRPSLKAHELIEWSEKQLGNRKELAHGFRILRNLLHEEKTVGEQDTLEAIRHVTQILNIVFPFDTSTLNGTCFFCKTPYNVSIPADQHYLGNTLSIPCNVCRRSINHIIMPQHP